MTVIIDTKVYKCLYCGTIVLLDSALKPGIIHDKDCPGALLEIGYLLKKTDFDKIYKNIKEN